MEDETAIQEPADDESELDGCDIEIADPTSDEDLPESEGGVE